MRTAWFLIKTTVNEWLEDKASRLGAALSFYAVFSLAPLLVVMIHLAGLWYGPQAAQGQLVGTLERFVGEQAAQTIQSLIVSAYRSGDSGTLASLLSFGALLIVASGLFAALQDALDTIWEVAPRPDRTWGEIIRSRALTFVMVLIGAAVLFASLIASTAVTAVVGLADPSIPGVEWLPALVNYVLPIVVFTVMIALIFKYLPDVEMSWRDIWLGSFLTAVLLAIGKHLISLYLAHSSTASAFGAAGSLAVLLLWIYYSAQIFFLGAEFTQVFANHVGHGTRPKASAVPLSEEARAQQGMPHKETLQPRHA